MTASHRVESVEVPAADGTPLAGQLYLPDSPRRLAILISHGTASAYNRHVAGWFGEHFAPHGFATLALNRRDHSDQNAHSTFEGGLEDIRAGIDLLEQRGFRHVYLCGHSKGSVYLARYVRDSADTRVAALGLYGAVDDNYTMARDGLMGAAYAANLALAQRRVSEGKGDELVSFDTAFGMQIELQSRGFLSYFGPDTLAKPVDDIREMSIPSLLCWCSTDGLTTEDMHLRILQSGQAAGVPVDYLRIEDTDPERPPHRGHAYRGMESKVTDETVQWLERNLPEHT